MLGEASTTEITKNKNAQGFNDAIIAAKRGGEVAGIARKNLEKKTGKKVVTKKSALESESKENLEEAEIKNTN